MTFQIIISPSFYQSTYNAPQESIMTVSGLPDDHADFDFHSDAIMQFASSDDAQAVIDSFDAGTYYLSYGEYGRPSYEIIEDECTGRECIRGEYADVVSEDDVPDDVLDELRNLSVNFSDVYDDAYDCFSEYVTRIEKDDDGDAVEVTYFIRYTVPVVNIQIEMEYGEPGILDWINPVYTKEYL